MDQKPKKLLDRVRKKIRLKNYSNKTEQAYLNWIKQHIIFHDKKHPQDMGAAEIEAFLTHLAVDRNVTAMDDVPKRILVRQLVHCYKVDPAFGRGVAEKLGIDMDEYTPWADISLMELIEKTSEENFVS